MANGNEDRRVRIGADGTIYVIASEESESNDSHNRKDNKALIGALMMLVIIICFVSIAVVSITNHSDSSAKTTTQSSINTSSVPTSGTEPVPESESANPPSSSQEPVTSNKSSSHSMPSVPATRSSNSSEDEKNAIGFVRAFYDDFELKNDEIVLDRRDWQDRCNPYVDKNSSIYSEMINIGLGSPFEKYASCCPVSEPTAKELRDNYYRVTIHYIATQNINLSKEQLDNVISNEFVDQWDIELDANGKVISAKPVE